MKPYFDLVVVIPVGPGTSRSFLCDTIESLVYFTRSSYKIVIMDDSREGLGASVMADFENMDLICTSKPSGRMGGLYISMCKAFAYVLEKYDCTLMMKLDTDALLIGPGPEQVALAFFRDNPRMAVAGQYPDEYDGRRWDFGWPRERIINGTMTWKYFKRPVGNIVLRKVYLKALRNGYVTGENVFGGASYFSRIFLSKIREEGFLPNSTLSSMNLGEDHLFSLLAKSVGMELGDLSSGVLPFACAWKGLPASPEELHLQGKKIIHSTRYWQKMNEEQVREYFKAKRIQVRPAPGVTPDAPGETSSG
ncbi:MAG: hypothetical protein ABI151_15940 [Chitinophagaceae bacterium]